MLRRVRCFVVGVEPDFDPLEQGLVHQSASSWGSQLVRSGGKCDERKRLIQGAHHVFDTAICGGLPALSVGLFLLDSVLFSLEDVFGDGVGVKELDELLLLCGELG
ncbi:MAG: hypothetical protein PGN13_09675 [Patulibacter minatonensis]